MFMAWNIGGFESSVLIDLLARSNSDIECSLKLTFEKVMRIDHRVMYAEGGGGSRFSHHTGVVNKRS